MKMQTAMESFEKSDSINTLKLALKSVAKAYGFSDFEFIDIGELPYNISLYGGPLGRAWEEGHQVNTTESIDVELGIGHARRTNTAFSWGNMAHPDKQDEHQKSEEIIELSKLQAIVDGLVVPYHFVDPAGRIYSGLIRFHWQDDIADYRSLLKENQVELHVLMVYWAQKAHDLILDSLKISSYFKASNSQENLKDAVLSVKETEVLSWAAIGKTNQEIAQTMDIQLDDVIIYMKSALKKLNVSNKTHAISKAIYLGLIEL